MAGALATAAVFKIAVVEMLFSPGKNCCALPVGMMEGNRGNEGRMGITGDRNDDARDVEDDQREDGEVSSKPVASRLGGMSSTSALSECCRLVGSIEDAGILYGRSSSTGRESQQVTDQSSQLGAQERNQSPEEEERYEEKIHEHSEISSLPSEQKQKRALMQCVLLEAGILFHGVFIGMALSVAVGNDFMVLLIGFLSIVRFPNFESIRQLEE